MMGHYRLESAGACVGACGRCGEWLGPADPARMVVYVDPRHGAIDCGLACEDCASAALAELNSRGDEWEDDADELGEASMTERIWILAESGPIEGLLKDCGETIVYYDGAPIHVGASKTIYTVDCDPALAVGDGWEDPGAYYEPIRIGARWYPRAEADYMRRIVRISSVKQAIAELARLNPCPLPWEAEYCPGLAPGQYLITEPEGRLLVGTADGYGPVYVPPEVLHPDAFHTRI